MNQYESTLLPVAALIDEKNIVLLGGSPDLSLLNTLALNYSEKTPVLLSFGPPYYLTRTGPDQGRIRGTLPATEKAVRLKFMCVISKHFSLYFTANTLLLHYKREV